MTRQKLGKHQRDWMERIRVAGGRVYLAVDREASPTVTAWILIKDGDDIRVPLRMMESLLERDLFEQVREEPGRHRVMYQLKVPNG